MTILTVIDGSKNDSPFDAIRQFDEQGNEFWTGRKLMSLLGYSKWQRFGAKDSDQISVIEKAIISCKNANLMPDDHFTHLPKQVSKAGTKGEDWKLSRYACYLIAMNGDVTKSEIAAAQTYFAVKAREAETVIPAQSDRLRELELELELAKTQERLSINQQKLLATVHLLETVSPGLAPLALGKQDAVVERVEYIDRVITPGKIYEGVGVTYIQKRFGFKSTQDTWNWLNSVGYSKDSGRWEIQPNVSHYHKIHPSQLGELDKLFYRKKGTRQRLIGE